MVYGHFMQDNAVIHTAKHVISALNEVFNTRL
jgi:hypothetical protein